MSYEGAKQRALPYLAPIPGPSATGAVAKLDPRYEAVLKEIGKLDSPAAGAVDWSAVAAKGGELLQSASKDLTIASYVAYALSASQGLAGLATGCAALAELMEGYWEGLFPELKRMRGRVNALDWFFDRASIAVGAARPTAANREALEELEVAAQRLAEVSRAKMDSQAPSPRKLLEAIERLRLSVPAPTSAAPAKTPSPPLPAPRQEAATLPEPAVAPALPPPEAMQDPTDFLRATGTSLAQAARQVQSTSPADPVGYRILRVGLWLHLRTAPPADSEKRTRVPPLAAGLRSRLEALAGGGRWLELLDDSEAALSQSRLALDLQRFSAEALRGLGEGHRAAREAVILELRALLQRMPALSSLRFSDGSPLADPATAAWLDAEVLPSPARVAAAPSPAAAPGPALDGEASPLDEARKLAGAKGLAEAVAFLQSTLGRCPSGAGRFRLRLQMARLLQESGQRAGAAVLYEALEAEAAARDLDEWDPPLAAECVSGALACAAPGEKDAGEAARQRRLAKLDPVAALKLSR
jgi:type VI secretion system protein VasJ